MSLDPLVTLPAGYVTGQAIAFTLPNDHAALVSAAMPLPVALARVATTALAGSTAIATTVGPFTPGPDQPIWLTLSGGWTGTVQLLRSTDGGATKLPLTAFGQPWASFTANANEAVVEESCAGATYYLQATLTGGTLTYRLAQ